MRYKIVSHKEYSSPGGHLNVKSVQSALSDLKSPPDRLQSQCNYQPFITELYLNGTLSETKLRPNMRKRNGQW